MRTLLRSLGSGKFLKSGENWTADPAAAMDLQSICRALELVRGCGLKHMEVVLTEIPAHLQCASLIQLLAEGDSVSGEPQAKGSIQHRLPSRGPGRKLHLGR